MKLRVEDLELVEDIGREIARGYILWSSKWVPIKSRQDTETIDLEISANEDVLLDLEITFRDFQHVIVVVAFAQFVVPEAFCSEFGGCVEEGGDGALDHDESVEVGPVVDYGG